MLATPDFSCITRYTQTAGFSVRVVFRSQPAAKHCRRGWVMALSWVLASSSFVVTDRWIDDVKRDRTVVKRGRVDGNKDVVCSRRIGPCDTDSASRSSGSGYVWTHGAGTDAVVDGSRQVAQVAEQRQSVLLPARRWHRLRSDGRVESYWEIQHLRVGRRRKVGHGWACTTL